MLILNLVHIHVLITVLLLFFSVPIFLDKEDPKLGARVLLCAPVWPIALVVLLIIGICKLFVIAEWVPEKREDKGRVHLYNPRQRPVEGGMRRASNPVEATPMTAIPKPPKKR